MKSYCDSYDAKTTIPTCAWCNNDKEHDDISPYCEFDLIDKKEGIYFCQTDHIWMYMSYWQERHDEIRWKEKENKCANCGDDIDRKFHYRCDIEYELPIYFCELKCLIPLIEKKYKKGNWHEDWFEEQDERDIKLIKLTLRELSAQNDDLDIKGALNIAKDKISIEGTILKCPSCDASIVSSGNESPNNLYFCDSDCLSDWKENKKF